MTHHDRPPLRLSDLHTGDTVTMDGAPAASGSANYRTTTPCCGRAVLIKREDIAFMAKSTTYSVTRYCRGCDWPYDIRVPALSAPTATFTVRPAPRHYTKH